MLECCSKVRVRARTPAPRPDVICIIIILSGCACDSQVLKCRHISVCLARENHLRNDDDVSAQISC